MNEVSEKLARSLSGSGPEILPYLPYLLQDLWELGTSAKEVTSLCRTQIGSLHHLRMLDLACGKGAASIETARLFPSWSVKGVDIVLEFIDAANKKAEEYGVAAQCEFMAEDINKAVEQEKGYDIVLLGSAGDVLGSPFETLQKLKKVLKPGGYILLADAYRPENIKDSQTSGGENILSYAEWLTVFEKSGVRLAAKYETDHETIQKINAMNNLVIGKRAEELKTACPEKKQMFEEYMQNQYAECKDMENIFSGVTWLLKINDEA